MNRNVAYSLVLRVAGILISLVVVPITLDYLNPYEYGIWITLNSILTWMNYFDIGLGNGLRNKLGEALAHKDYQLGKIYVSTTFFLLFLIVFVICTLLLIINKFIDWNQILNITEPINNINYIVNLVLICVSFTFILKTIGIVYMAYQKTWVNALLTFLGSVLSLIWIIFLREYSSPSLLNVAFAFSASPVIVYLIFYPIAFFISFKEIRPSPYMIKMKHSKSLASLGIKFFILQIACLLMFATSNFLVSNIFTPLEVTPYSISSKYFNAVATAFMLFVNPLWAAITDAYAKKEFKWISHNIIKMVKIWGLCTLVMLIMVLVSPLIYKIWVGEIDIPYSLSLSVAVYNIVFLITNIFSAYCNGVGHLNEALWSMCASAVIFIPFCYYFSNIVGVTGVPYSMAIVLFIPLIAMFRVYKRDTKIS